MGNTSAAWVQCLAATALSLMLTGIFTWYARRRGMLEIPTERHSHTTPTPVGGGAGIVLSLAIMVLLQPGESSGGAFWSWCLLPGFFVLGLIGWWDDQVSLSALFRFAVQVLVSFQLLSCFGAHGLFTGSWWFLLSLAYLLWMTNLYNFMDGSNGMAGFQGVFAGTVLAWLYIAAGDRQTALVSAFLACACFGFLPWNLGRARVFMGDVASGPLGFAFAALLIHGVLSGSFSIPVAWLVMLVFMCDSTLTLLARVMKGEQWYNPHKQHLYQRLIACGWKHGSVLLLYQLVNLVLVLPAIAVALKFPASALPVAFAVTLALGFGWLLTRQKIGVLAQAG